MLNRFARNGRSAIATLITRVVDMRLPAEVQQGGKVIVAADVGRLDHISFAGKNAVGRGASFKGKVSIGYGTTIGANDNLNGPLTIGRYCQLGSCVGIYGKDHPVSFASIYVNKTLFDGRLSQHSRVAEVTIEHDVWMGHGAVVLRGVKVGSGAIVGANAVVTAPVPPYAIVAGNPARIIRRRFSAEVIALLLELQWWQMSPAELLAHEHLFHVDFAREPEQAISLLRDALLRREATGTRAAAEGGRPTRAI